MIGYGLLVLIAAFVVILGSIVVGVAVWGWKQEKLKALSSSTPQGEQAVAGNTEKLEVSHSASRP
jgi:hypothetical protein